MACIPLRTTANLAMRGCTFAMATSAGLWVHRRRRNGCSTWMIPQTGDRVTVLEKWMDLDQNGKVAQVGHAERGHPDLWRPDVCVGRTDAAPGEYIVGFASKTWMGMPLRSTKR